jgi:hypothetical protein
VMDAPRESLRWHICRLAVRTERREASDSAYSACVRSFAPPRASTCVSSMRARSRGGSSGSTPSMTNTVSSDGQPDRAKNGRRVLIVVIVEHALNQVGIVDPKRLVEVAARLKR